MQKNQLEMAKIIAEMLPNFDEAASSIEEAHSLLLTILRESDASLLQIGRIVSNSKLQINSIVSIENHIKQIVSMFESNYEVVKESKTAAQEIKSGSNTLQNSLEIFKV